MFFKYQNVLLGLPFFVSTSASLFPNALFLSSDQTFPVILRLFAEQIILNFIRHFLLEDFLTCTVPYTFLCSAGRIQSQNLDTVFAFTILIFVVFISECIYVCSSIYLQLTILLCALLT